MHGALYWTSIQFWVKSPVLNSLLLGLALDPPQHLLELTGYLLSVMIYIFFCIYMNRLKLIETYRYSALLIQFVIVNMFRFSGWFLFLGFTFNKTVRRKKITSSLNYGTVCLEDVLKNNHTCLIETWEFVQLSLWLYDLSVPQVFLIWFWCRMGCGERNLLNSKNK